MIFLFIKWGCLFIGKRIRGIVLKIIEFIDIVEEELD